MACTTYRLFGLMVRSEIALPELEALAGGGAAHVEIVRGAVPRAEGDGTPSWIARTEDGAIVHVERIARFRIGGGSRITVDAEPGAAERDVRLFLLGSAMGALLHQRGVLPLHANAIDLDGGAIAFLGRSGSGKSTIAAAFHDRGRRVLSDDVCAIVRDGAGRFLAEAGVPRLRLWRDAVERSGRNVDAHERAFSDVDKYTIEIARASVDPLPIRAIYLLAEPGEAFAIERFSASKAVEALIANTYRGSYLKQIGDARLHFETCLALARQTPVFELRRPWDTARIGELVDRVEAHLAGLS